MKILFRWIRWVQVQSWGGGNFCVVFSPLWRSFFFCKSWAGHKRKYVCCKRKLGETEHEKYAYYTLPRNSGDILFEETVLIQKKIFGGKSSLIQHKVAVLRHNKKSGEDYSIFVGFVNRVWKVWIKRTFTPDMFKCLIFGLMVPEDGEIWTRICLN